MSEKKQEGKTLIRLFAELMSDIAVPRSLGKQMLGKGTEAYDEIHSRLMGMGWHKADAYEKEIKKDLKTKLLEAVEKLYGDENNNVCNKEELITTITRVIDEEL